MADNKFIVLDNLTYYNEKIQEQTQQIQQKTTELDNSKVNRSGDNITGSLNVEGALTLPNSPTNPETASVTDTYTTRQTANAAVTGLTVVDGSATQVTKIMGDTKKSNNLLGPYVDNSKIMVNCEFTINDDYSVTVTGTYQSDSGYRVQDFVLAKNLILPAGNYYISGCPAGSSTYTYRLFVQIDRANGSVDYSASDYGSGNSFTLAAGDVINTIAIRIGDELVNANLTFYPMLNKGTLALPYQKYFNDEPFKHAKISSVKSAGRNLFDISKVSNFNYLINNGDGTLTISTSFTVPTKETLKQLCPSLKAGDIVTFSFNTTATDKPYILLFDNTDNTYTQWNSGSSLTITEILLDNVLVFYLNSDSDTESRTISNIQIEYGTIATSYKPYIKSVYQLSEALEIPAGCTIDFENNTRTTEIFEEILDFTGLSYVKAGDSWQRDGFFSAQASAAVLTHNAYGMADYQLRKQTDMADDFEIGKWEWSGESFTYGNEKYILLGNNSKYVLFILSNSELGVNQDDTDEVKLAACQTYFNNNPFKVRYLLATPIVEDFVGTLNLYTVWNNGTESIINDNSIYGVNPTITQIYSIHENPTEAANKAYVNNGLATKLDKRGGTITGNLIVEGVTDTALGAIVSKKNDVSYGLTYDGDAYKLGQGTVNEDGDFSYNEGEGLPITLRSDSNEFLNNNLVKWDSDGNKIVDSGLSATAVATTNDIPTIYTSASTDPEAGFTTTKTLKIYVDADGYLHIDTTETE